VLTTIRRATWNVYKNNLGSQDQEATAETRSAQGYAAGTGPNYIYTLINPVSLAFSDLNGRPLQQIQAKSPTTDRPPLPGDVFTQADYVRWTAQHYIDHFHLSSQDVYHSIPSGIDTTSFDYDVMFRTNKTETPGGTITRTVFDHRNNPVSTGNSTVAQRPIGKGPGIAGHADVQIARGVNQKRRINMRWIGVLINAQLHVVAGLIG
jgi:hypothetical protein